MIDVLVSLALNVGYLVCWLLGYLMFKSSPPRLPKIAVLLMLIGGLVLTTLFGWFLTWIVGLLSGAALTIYTAGMTLLFVYLLYTVVNELLPKLGKVAGGSVNFSTGMRATLLPTVAVATGGAVAVWLNGILERGGSAVANVMNQGF